MLDDLTVGSALIWALSCFHMSYRLLCLLCFSGSLLIIMLWKPRVVGVQGFRLIGKAVNLDYGAGPCVQQTVNHSIMTDKWSTPNLTGQPPLKGDANWELLNDI